MSRSVYDKTGKRLVGPITTTTFWANQPDCGGNQIWSDSVVIYDRQADRWVISRPGGLPNGADLCLAVSQTADPTGRWDEYAFEVNNNKNGLGGLFQWLPEDRRVAGRVFGLRQSEQDLQRARQHDHGL
jgi:hypothetical protein